MPVAKKLASNTTAAIEHLNKNLLRINEPQYQQYLTKIERRSRVESRCVGERLRGIWEDADYLGSVRAEVGSAKIRCAAFTKVSTRQDEGQRCVCELRAAFVPCQLGSSSL
jgi:hypothetical protein